MGGRLVSELISSAGPSGGRTGDTTVPELTNDPEVLSQWVGHRQTITDHVSAGAVQRLAFTLDHPDPPMAGDPLPPLWHYLFFAEVAPTGSLGADGHPPRGGFLPPVALPRRMWAQSHLTFHEPIPVGAEAERTSTITDVQTKHGSSGPLCFVTVDHQLTVDGRIRITERQDLVYRGDPDPAASPREPDPAPNHAEFTTTVRPNPVLLFRYSALTFNGHRIHYDQDYAQQVEGYPGLVVHGPLTATLLANLAVRHIPDGQHLTSFSFRGVAPLVADSPFTLAGAHRTGGLDLWAATTSGGLAVTARADYASTVEPR